MESCLSQFINTFNIVDDMGILHVVYIPTNRTPQPKPALDFHTASRVASKSHSQISKTLNLEPPKPHLGTKPCEGDTSKSIRVVDTKSQKAYEDDVAGGGGPSSRDNLLLMVLTVSPMEKLIFFTRAPFQKTLRN